MKNITIMQTKKKAFITIIAMSFMLFTLPAIANKDKHLVFGFNLDGAPLSSPKTTRGIIVPNEILGFCKHLLDYLQQEGYTTTTQPLSIKERFEKFSVDLKGKAGVLCGPNTITNERKSKLALISAEFSKPFITTTAKVLIKANKIDLFYDKQQRGRLKISFLSVNNKQSLETTSASIARSLNVQMVVLPSRMEAIRRLQLAETDHDAIDAYLSDEIILMSMLQEQNAFKKPQHFQIEPANDLAGYSWENFGLVAYNSPELTLLLNKWLNSPVTKKQLHHYITDNTFTHRCSIDDDCGVIVKTSLLSLLARVLAVLLVLIFCGVLLHQLLKLKKKMAANTAPDTTEKAAEKEPIKPLLTPAETKVCILLIEGLSSKEMAREFHVARKTVEVHRSNIKRKIGSSPRQLMDYAHKQRLL